MASVSLPGLEKSFFYTLRRISDIYSRPSEKAESAVEEIPRYDLDDSKALAVRDSNPSGVQDIQPFGADARTIQPALFNNGQPVTALYIGPTAEVKIPV